MCVLGGGMGLTVCYATTNASQDPSEIRTAIDFHAFTKAMTAETWPHPLQPNFLYDRMFDYYDTSRDDLIDFGEFVRGMAYLLLPAKRGSMERVFRGYDADNDGFVSRSDFMRMLSAKYAIHKTIILDHIGWEKSRPYGLPDEAEIVRSTQPLSSAFNDMDIPGGEVRRPRNKPIDSFGDSQIAEGGGLFARTILPDGESDMDLSFWNAVFDRYGRPNRLSDLHPNFNESLEGRAQARQRYTGSELLSVGEDGAQDSDRYLVATDSRRRRGPLFNREPLQDQWRQDLEDARNGRLSGETRTNGGVESQSAHSQTNSLERGMAYDVPASEKDFGNEVIFQVVQEGFNEMLDPLFKPKEGLAAQVRATAEERRKYRFEIDELKKAKEEFRKELKAGSEIDPLFATAMASYSDEIPPATNGLPGHDPALRQSAFENAIARVTPRNTGTPLPLPPSSIAVQQQEPRSDRHTPSTDEQAEISQLIRENLIPVDEASLEDMESSIRSRPLEELLESAGYSIASPIEERSSPLTAQSGNSAYSDPAHYEVSITETTTDPTLPQNRSNVEASNEEGSAPTPMHLSPSSPRTPPPPEPLQELPETPQAAITSGESAANAEDIQDASFSTTDTGTSASAETGTDAEPSSAEDNSEAFGQPSAGRLHYLAMVDAEEAEIRSRGGPGRLNLNELEDIVLKDQREGGALRGLVESWLEWAAF